MKGSEGVVVSAAREISGITFGAGEDFVVSAARDISGITFGEGTEYVAGSTVDIGSVKFDRGKDFVLSAAREMSDITFGEGRDFVQMVSATGMRSPVRIERNRIYIFEDEIETEKPYFIRYGNKKLVIRKREDGKIHVDKLS